MTAQISIFEQHTSKTFSFDFKVIFLSAIHGFLTIGPEEDGKNAKCENISRVRGR